MSEATFIFAAFGCRSNILGPEEIVDNVPLNIGRKLMIVMMNKRWPCDFIGLDDKKKTSRRIDEYVELRSPDDTVCPESPFLKVF